MHQLLDTKDGCKTLKIDGIYIHSKFSPLKEAKRFITTTLSTKSTVLILGGGLGYIFKAIRDISPDIEIINIPYDRELGELSLRINKTERVQWDTIEPVKTFIDRTLNITNIKGLQVIEWEPSHKTHVDFSNNINNVLVQSIRKINGNIMTTARFGKKWIKNSLKNFIQTTSYVENFTVNRPIAIVASGKSLDASIHILKKNRNSFTVLALSSAVLALTEHNITPDIIFSTDPGYYSKLHLYAGVKTPLLAMPLSNSMESGAPVLLLNQGNQFEHDIIYRNKIPNISINENGTVAGTALEFAINYSKGSIYLFGQDLAPTDIISHLTPYAFDNLLQSSESRIKTYYSTLYNRWIESGITYKTYRDWFSAISQKHPNRIFRVGSETESIYGISDLKEVPIYSYSPKHPLTITTQNTGVKEDRIEIVLALVSNWIKLFENKKISENYLFYLISTSIYTDITSKALSKSAKEAKLKQGKDESILFLEGLLKLYGRKLLQ